MKVETTNLLTVKNFAIRYGEKVRSEPYSASYIYKLLKDGKINTSLVVDIDGVTFIRTRALDKKI